MRFVILTNTLNPHMKPLADSLYNRIGSEFCFIQKYMINSERKELGWSEEKVPYLLNLQDEDQTTKCRRLIVESDIVYFGANPDMFVDIMPRLKLGKLTYFHSERLFKHGILQFFSPFYLMNYIKQRIIPSYFSNVNILSASAYLYYDYLKIHANTNRIYNFGYFPTLMLYENSCLIENKNTGNVKIICAGRFLKWKHFDNVIWAVGKLVSLGYENIQFELIGNGKEYSNLRKLVKKLEIEKYVIFVGPLHPLEVRKKMENADIFIMPSDKKEGWGVVVNEAMNSGCAVLASSLAGSVPILIKDGYNGLIFKNGNKSELLSKLQMLIDDPIYRLHVGLNAYKTISEIWNSNIAADRILEFSDFSLKGLRINYTDGPLSKAILIK